MVSVVITAYNYARYIERSVRSALDQSLGRAQYEVIVVNDASTDNTMDILANYQDEIKVINLDKNVGLAAARNIGIRKARGQFVVFLDADDYLHKDLLYVQRLFLSENDALNAVSVDYYLVDNFGSNRIHMNAEEHPIACGIMFRKDLLYDVGLYDVNFRAREEEDLRLRFLKKYSIHHLILPLYRYRKHDANLSSNQEEMKKYKKILTKKHRK
jgi:glycosyltransferase involved in cell wall biosynthesis